MRTRPVFCLLVATVATVISVAVGAAPLGLAAGAADATQREKVGYSDLDLSSGAAVRAFYERLNVAAAHVCEPYSAVDDRAFRICSKQVLATAVTQIHSPALTQYAGTQSIGIHATALRVAGAP